MAATPEPRAGDSHAALAVADQDEAAEAGAGPRLAACPLCGTRGLVYLFTGQGTHLERCPGCGLILRNPQPPDDVLARIYADGYFLGSTDDALAETQALKRATAALYLDEIDAYLRQMGEEPSRGRLLEIGCGHGDLLLEARQRGYEVTGLELSPVAADAARRRLGPAADVREGLLEAQGWGGGAFDLCVLADVLEHSREPVALLERVHRLVRPGGAVFVAVPSLDSWSARLLRQRWIEFKTEHLFYFDRETIRSLLSRCGFGRLRLRPGRKVLNADYVFRHFERFPVAGLTPLARLARAALPRGLRRRPLRLVASGLLALGRRQPGVPAGRRTQRLSVVMPVYNERATFPQAMRALLEKSVPGLEIEIIVVESGSSDGTREEVLRQGDHPRVRVVLEPRPRGKGHAVRAGLCLARGDFVLIQDADLEYDLHDYEALLEPLRSYRRAFVLGSRHAARGSWKIRRFANRLHVSLAMNAGHQLFTLFFNLLFGQRLRDPFTMYKVFRRDCLQGVRLVRDGFDFDCELVAKLVRLGFRPLELPVNYRSRGFDEGKKVSFLRDPPTYVRAFLSCRFARVESWFESEPRP